jgi:hypothetical protein
MALAALFTKAKSKLTQYSLIDEGINKWEIYIQWIIIQPQKGMEFQYLMLREVSQTQKDKCHVIPRM